MTYKENAVSSERKSVVQTKPWPQITQSFQTGKQLRISLSKKQDLPYLNVVHLFLLLLV